MLLGVLRHVKVGEVLLPLLEDVHGVDDAGLVEDDLRAVEDEPGEGHADDDGDVDGLAEASFGLLVVDGVEQVDDLMLFEFSEAAASHLDGRGGRSGVGRRFERGHGLLILTAAGRESCAA